MARRKSKKNNVFLKIVKIAVIAVFVIFLTVIVIQKTIYIFKHADLFNVKEISLGPSIQFIKSRHLDRLKGRNIFEIDLKKTQQRLEVQYPEVEKLRIIRQLPNRVYVFAQKRDPFAYLSLGSQYAILDNKAIVLAVTAKLSKGGIPVISGVALKADVILGKPVRDYRVRLALRIVDQLHKNEHLKSYKITSVDVVSVSQILVYLNDDMKIIMDQDKTSQKISKLGIFLSQGNIKDKSFNYIDLRFKEIYLGQKKEK